MLTVVIALGMVGLILFLALAALAGFHVRALERVEELEEENSELRWKFADFRSDVQASLESSYLKTSKENR